jgi:hypothetical protein
MKDIGLQEKANHKIYNRCSLHVNKVILYDNNESYVNFLAESNPKLVITSYNLSTLDGETFFKTIHTK